MKRCGTGGTKFAPLLEDGANPRRQLTSVPGSDTVTPLARQNMHPGRLGSSSLQTLRVEEDR